MAGLPIGPLYLKMTTPRNEGNVTLAGARDIFGELSITSQFKVCLHLGSNKTDFDSPQYDVLSWLTDCGLTDNASRAAEFDFFCAEASLPGGIFDVASESGSRQGVTEKFAMQRVYSPFEITLYVDNDYKIIRLFEEWMNFINPLYNQSSPPRPTTTGQGGLVQKQNYFRMRYPDSYKRTISIVKFERNFIKDPNKKLTDRGNKLLDQPTMTYRMLEAFPKNITAMPVTYEGSSILKTTVSFEYSRYIIEKNNGEQAARPSR
jgi:hypothetical protein